MRNTTSYNHKCHILKQNAELIIQVYASIVERGGKIKDNIL